mgnify:CR=1 FL=1
MNAEKRQQAIRRMKELYGNTERTHPAHIDAYRTGKS